MNTWFRFYNQAIRDPKVMRLSDSDFRLWVSMLAIASENGGSIPPLDDLKLLLNRRLDHLSSGIDRLIKAVLIDQLKDGYEPHNWTKFQYRSDNSTERVQRFRNNRRNSEETPPEPESDTETEQSPPAPRQNGGPGLADPEILAKELCELARIPKHGPASTEHVRRWLSDGIPETTIREVVKQMTHNAGGTTRSLKRFDQPIRREHAERRPALNGSSKPLSNEERVAHLTQTADWFERHGRHDDARERRQEAERIRGPVPIGELVSRYTTPTAAGGAG